MDPDTLAEVDRVGKPLGLKRAEIVRQALREWVRRRTVARFEDEWVTALRNRRDAHDDADNWRAIQTWSRK